MLTLLFVSVFTFAFAWLLLRWLLRSKLANLVIDQPNHRSLHTVPVPRTGGLAIMTSTLFSWAFSGQFLNTSLIICALALTLLSFIDDFRGLSPGWRFLGHFVVAAIFIGLALSSIPAMAMIVLVVSIVWTTNLFNFMDGADGLAGGMALFGFGAYAIAAWLSGNNQLAIISLSVAASSGAFLVYNFHPARIFMGDAGSIPIGFLVAAIGLIGWHSGNWPLWFPVLVFSPFIIDASATLAKRLFRGERLWDAHRSHYYQRLIMMNWGHRRVASTEYILMFIVSVSAIWLVRQSAEVKTWGGVAWVLIYAILTLWIDFLWRQHQKLQQRDTTSAI